MKSYKDILLRTYKVTGTHPHGGTFEDEITLEAHEKEELDKIIALNRFHKDGYKVKDVVLVEEKKVRLDLQKLMLIALKK